MKKIKLTKGKYTIVDDEDFVWLNQWKWCINDSSYARRNIYLGGGRKNQKNRGLRMHRAILKRHGNKIKGMLVDHINRNRLDNRKKNLRLVDDTYNAINSKVRIDNTSGYRGIFWDKSRKKWTAQISFRRKHFNLGRFIDINDAINARREAELKYFGKIMDN